MSTLPDVAPSRRRELLGGIRDEAPILLGVAPFGVIFGALALAAHLSAPAAQAMSSVIFAGSAQFIAAQLFAGSASGLVIVAVVLVVNLRHALYSASMAPHVRHLGPVWKAALAYLLTDEAYAVVIAHYNQPGDGSRRHWYFLGAGLTLWSGWQASTAVGILLGSRIPAAWPLGFMMPLTFIALVVPRLRERSTISAALVAGFAGALAMGLPLKTGLLVAALVGIATGLLVEDAAMNVWLTIGVAGLLTFAIRLSFIYLLGRVTAPEWFMRALRFVPVAVLSAIIVPETITWQGAVTLSWRNPQIWAAAVAILVALRVKNVLAIIGAGMVALLLFRWLVALF